tara:strand:- start:926 stop:1069 length:144 start_codon:yes stop_codon:yes gene_type:complete
LEWKIDLEMKKKTLKQKTAPRVDETNISGKLKLVVTSAMDAANKNLT